MVITDDQTTILLCSGDEAAAIVAKQHRQYLARQAREKAEKDLKQ